MRVSVEVPLSPQDAWKALTEREVVRHWFGDLSQTLRSGGAHRLDFGDGDFFAISDVVLERPHRVSYRWRFLGTGPIDAIAWSIEDLASGSRVTVVDTEPGRTPSGCSEMIEGWTDFLQRLQNYASTGQSTRYVWRKEFSGSIELPLPPEAAFDKLLSRERQGAWLPWCGAGIEPAALLTITDGQEPARLVVSEVERPGRAALRFSLTCSGWRAPTDVSIGLQPWPSGALLLITHTGWDGISADETEQAAQRARFGALWVNALRATARALAG